MAVPEPGWSPPSDNQGSPPPTGMESKQAIEEFEEAGNITPGFEHGKARPPSLDRAVLTAQQADEARAQSAQATNMAISMMTSAGDIAQAQAAGSAAETYLANQLQMALSHAPTTETDFGKRYDMMVESERIARGTATTSNDMNQIARDKLDQEMRVAGFDEAQIRNTLNTISVREQAVELERLGIAVKDQGINDAITLITERMDDVDYDEVSFGRDIAELNNKIDSVTRQSEELGFQTTDLQSLKMTADALSDAREVLIAFEMESVGARAGIETEAVGLGLEGLGLAETYQTAEEAAAAAADEAAVGRIALAGQELGVQREGLDIGLEEVGLEEAGLDIEREEVGLEEAGLDIERERLGLAGSGLELSEEEIGLGEEDIATQMERFAIQRESVGRQAMRGEKAAETEAAARGASFTTGLRADVANIEAARADSIADIGLQEQQLATQLGLSGIERLRLGLGGQEIGLREAELGLQGEGLGLDLGRLDVAGEGLGLDRERLGLAGHQLDVEQRGLDLSQDELASQRALEEAGFEFQTGQRGIEEDELGLTQRSIDQTAAEGMAGLEYQQAEANAARADAEVAFGANMRNLGLQDADLSDMAENLNADVADVRDAVSRLDTVRLGHQTEIANLGRELEQSGLDRQQLDLRLQDYGYQRDDVQTALDALDVRRETLVSSGKEIDLRDVLVQTQLDTDLNTIAAGRTALAEEQAGYITELEQYNEDTATWNAYLAEQSKLDTATAGQAGAAAYLGAMPWAMEAASDPFFRQHLPGNIFDEVGGMYEEYIVSQLPESGYISESSIPEVGWDGANWGHPATTTPESDMAGQTVTPGGPPSTYVGYSQEEIDYFESPEVQSWLARLG